jgi:hypothetical protein
MDWPAMAPQCRDAKALTTEVYSRSSVLYTLVYLLVHAFYSAYDWIRKRKLEKDMIH